MCIWWKSEQKRRNKGHFPNGWGDISCPNFSIAIFRTQRVHKRVFDSFLVLYITKYIYQIYIFFKFFYINTDVCWEEESSVCHFTAGDVGQFFDASSSEEHVGGAHNAAHHPLSNMLASMYNAAQFVCDEHDDDHDADGDWWWLDQFGRCCIFINIPGSQKPTF